MTRNPLDTSSPDITHTPIPLHGGEFQGVSVYNGPSEWPFLSYQTHWACPNCSDMPDDPSLGLLNPGTSHIHFEWAIPIYGEITSSITVPFRMQAFHLKGKFYLNSGPMIRNVIFDPPQDVPWHNFQGDPEGVVIVNGHLTLDVHSGDGGPNIHSASPNGWTNFMCSAIALLDNGDVMGVQGMSPIFTLLDPSIPENTGFGPNTSSGAGITSVADGGSAAWGSQISEVREGFLPLLAPINTTWPIPNLFGYMYGGKIPADGVGLFQLYKDLDLHNGSEGTAIPGAPPSGNGPGFLDPVVIGTGVHKLGLVWQVTTGPNGIPGVAIPNEVATALLVFNVEVGGDVTIPPPIVCTDPVVVSTNTVTSEWTAGVNQTRTIVTTTVQSRTCK